MSTSFTLRQIRDAIIDMINQPPGHGQREVPYIEGDPGIGKTSMMRSIYRDLMRSTAFSAGFTHFVEYVAPEHEPTDFMMPFPNADRTAVSMLPCEEFRYGKDDRVFFFIDEIDKAPTMMQNILGRIGNDMQVGNFFLPEGSFVAMAGNKLSNKAGGIASPTHIKSRRVYMSAHVDPMEWIEDVGIPMDVHPSVVSYIRTNPDILHKFDAGAPTFPSPRTWTKAGLVLNHQMSETTERIRISGHIGHEAANTFWGHLQIFRSLRSVDEIVKNPSKVPVPEGKNAQAIMYAEVTALARWADVRTVNPICTYFNRLPGEFAFCGYKDMLQRSNDLVTKHAPEAQKWLVKNHAIIMATGRKKAD